MTDELSPADLATFDQHWQAVNRSVDQLVSSFSASVNDGTTQRELDLLLFAGALSETTDAESLSAMLACAVSRLAERHARLAGDSEPCGVCQGRGCPDCLAGDRGEVACPVVNGRCPGDDRGVICSKPCRPAEGDRP
jgi:hypothetical protein